MLHFLRWVYTVWVGIVFIGLMLICLPFFMLYPLFGYTINLWLASLTMIFWFRAFLLLVGMPLWIHGRFKTRYARPCVFISNHASFLDTPAVKSTLGFGFQPLGKKEQTKQPVLGWIYRHNVILVDRSNPESRAISMANMGKLIRRKVSVFVFPEGTMNRSPYLLNSFYDGAFRLAIENQVPICPFISTNTRNLMPRGVFPMLGPGAIHMYFGEPIPTLGLTMENLPSLKQQSYDAMYDLLKQHAPKRTAGYDNPEKAPLNPTRAKPGND